MFESNQFRAFFEQIETEKRKEIFIEGKLPHEREGGLLRIHAWRILSLLIITGLCVSLYLVTKVVNYIYSSVNSLDFYIAGPLSLGAMLLVLLVTGQGCFDAIIKRNPTYEFAVLMKPLVLFFLMVSILIGGVALGMFGATHK